MKISVGFSTTNSFISRIIRWITNAKVSHTYIRLYDDHLHAPLVIHADWIGIIIEHAEIFDLHNIVIEEYEIDDDRLNDGFIKNLKHLKKKYAWGDIFHWALALKFKRWFKRKIKHPTEDPKRMICVDFVIRILNDSNITHLPLGTLLPKTLRKWFQDNYQTFGWKNDKKINNK